MCVHTVRTRAARRSRGPVGINIATQTSHKHPFFSCARVRLPRPDGRVRGLRAAPGRPSSDFTDGSLVRGPVGAGGRELFSSRARLLLCGTLRLMLITVSQSHVTVRSATTACVAGTRQHSRGAARRSPDGRPAPRTLHFRAALLGPQYEGIPLCTNPVASL
jgi:hypothetical protein